MKLYELKEEYQGLLTALEDEEDPGAFETAVKQLEGEIEVKVENIGLLIKWLEAESKMVDGEIKRLSQRRDSWNGRVSWLKGYLLQNIDRPYKFPLVSVGFQRNPPSVVVDDLSLLQSEFIRVIPESYEPNKTAIKDAWKMTGEVPAGARIVEGNMRLVVR